MVGQDLRRSHTVYGVVMDFPYTSAFFDKVFKGASSPRLGGEDTAQ